MDGRNRPSDGKPNNRGNRGLSVVALGLLLVEIGGVGALVGLALGIGGTTGAVLAALLPDERSRANSRTDGTEREVFP